MLPWKNRFITFGVTLDERSEGTDNMIHLLVSKTLYVLQHFLCDMCIKLAQSWTGRGMYTTSDPGFGCKEKHTGRKHT
jgi:hypothetical protein